MKIRYKKNNTISSFFKKLAHKKHHFSLKSDEKFISKINRNLNSFIKKLAFKYRASLTNKETKEEVWSAKISRFSLLLFFMSLFLFALVLTIFTLYVSPLGDYLPTLNNARHQIALVNQSLQIDSLTQEIKTQAKFIDLIKSSIKTQHLKEISIKEDTVKTNMQPQKLIPKSKAEIAFVDEYEAMEKYNLSSMPTKATEKVLIFFKPANGVVNSTFQPSENRYGISIITTSSQETVKSVLEGIVISTQYTFSNDWVIQVQHNNNYVSIYKNNIKLLKSVGDKVRAGESLAITGNQEKGNTKKYFYFELWNKGNPINPQEVITF